MPIEAEVLIDCFVMTDSIGILLPPGVLICNCMNDGLHEDTRTTAL